VQRESWLVTGAPDIAWNINKPQHIGVTEETKTSGPFVVALSGVYAAPLELSGGAVEDRCLEIACEIGIKIRTVESESQISRLILVAKNILE
jgi:hypothetical protein